MPRQRCGLTLIELLVVMTVLIVLLGVLLPALLRAREAARSSECRGNYKQFTLAFHNCHDEYLLAAPSRSGSRLRRRFGADPLWVRRTRLIGCQNAGGDPVVSARFKALGRRLVRVV
jgi:hypothetical protein